MTSKELQAQEELKIIPESKAVFGRRAAGFDSLVERHINLAMAIKKLEAERKAISNQLLDFLADHDTKTVMSDGNRVTLVQSVSTSFNKQKLIEKYGVPATAIVDCTEEKPYVFVKVTPPKGQE